MFRLTLICILSGLLLCFAGHAQNTAQPAAASYSYYHPSKDKESWQRLHLWLAASFVIVVLEGQGDMDSCLYAASRSMGVSRYAVIAEGISNPELAAQSKWIDRWEPHTAIRLLTQTTGRKHLQLLTLLGAYYTFHPHSYETYKDSVEYFLTRAIAESKALQDEKTGRQALCLLGKMYIQVNHPKGDSIFNLLINQCRKAGDKETEARAFAWRGRYTGATRNTLLPKLNDLQKAVELNHHLNNKEAEINALTDLGYMLVVTRQFEAANASFLKALTLAEALHFPYTHYNTEALAMVNKYQGKFGEPFRYALQTIKTAESTRDSLGWGYFYHRLALHYYVEGRHAEGTAMAQKSLDRFLADGNPTLYNALQGIIVDMSRQNRNKEALSLTLNVAKKIGPPQNKSDLFFYYNTLATAYMNAGELDSASAYAARLDSLEIISEAITGPLRRTSINDLYAMILYNRNEFRKARELFEKHFTFTSITDRDLASDMEIYRWLLLSDSALNDNASAVVHYKKYKLLLDSSFKVTSIRQGEELKTLYETQEKEQKIALLNKQATLVKDNLRKTTLLKDLTLAGIAAVVIIAALLYRQNRQKQKSNQVITSKNEQLQQLVTDKEWLLKEVHHRVKNNLQIVMSLLNSQAVYIHNDAALTAIQDSKRRVFAMSLIHQKLYQSKNIATIDMPEYINDLVTYVQDSFNTKNQITFEQQIEPLQLDVSQAIPLGLIINECVVNTIKYAFPDGRRGVTRISLLHNVPDDLVLKISDNGIGIPVAPEKIKHHSLGFDLIKGLAQQLKGTLNIVSNNGLHITIRFAVISKQISEEALSNT